MPSSIADSSLTSRLWLNDQCQTTESRQTRWVIASEAKPFGPELTAEGQSQNGPDMKEIATALRVSLDGVGAFYEGI